MNERKLKIIQNDYLVKYLKETIKGNIKTIEININSADPFTICDTYALIKESEKLLMDLNFYDITANEKETYKLIQDYHFKLKDLETTQNKKIYKLLCSLKPQDQQETIKQVINFIRDTNF